MDESRIRLMKGARIMKYDYYFSEYRDRAGVGSTQKFRTKREALKAAREEWDHLSEHDKKSYTRDTFAWFYVSRVLKDQDPDENPYILWEAF